MDKIAIIGTPQHQRCIVETLKEMDGWKNMMFKPDIPNNIALWEEWQSIEKLKTKKKELESINRSSVFYREYLCEIVGDEDQLFREEYLKTYEGTISANDQNDRFLNITELNGKPVDKTVPINIFMGVDPASSTRKSR